MDTDFMQELEEEVKSKFDGRFGQVMLGLLDHPLDYYAKELNRAIEVCCLSFSLDIAAP